MRVQVNVSDTLVERIDYFARMLGNSRSGLCNYFIGLGIASLETSFSAVDKTISDFSAELSEQLKGQLSMSDEH